VSESFDCASSFAYSHARLLERWLLAVRSEGAEPGAAGRVASAYQNPDGGRRLRYCGCRDIRSYSFSVITRQRRRSL
jgi:hypothetical protein